MLPLVGIDAGRACWRNVWCRLYSNAKGTLAIKPLKRPRNNRDQYILKDSFIVLCMLNCSLSEFTYMPMLMLFLYTPALSLQSKIRNTSTLYSVHERDMASTENCRQKHCPTGKKHDFYVHTFPIKIGVFEGDLQ